jgi:hypothetical protein
MGARGRRSAADLSTPRSLSVSIGEQINIPALAQQYRTSQREVLRAIRRAERRGEAVSRISRDGSLVWYWTA